MKPTDLLTQAQGLIREGIRAVPQMKYVLAIGAIVGMISIIVATLKLDLKVALFGILLMLLLMSLVVIFARVAALQQALRLPAIVMTWFSMALMIASVSLLFTSVFWAKPLNLTCWLDSSRCVSGEAYAADDPYKRLRTPAENQVIELMDKIGDLRQYLLTLNRYPDSRAKLAPAKNLADTITGVSDHDLNPTRRYIKREYGALAYLMAAASEESDLQKHKSLCTLAIKYCDEALSLFKEARERYQNYPNDLNAKLLTEWVPEDKSDDRVLYFRTEALCMRAKIEGDASMRAQALETWSMINTSYKGQFPASGTDELIGCITDTQKGEK
jgi:hypothetical protein